MSYLREWPFPALEASFGRPSGTTHASVFIALEQFETTIDLDFQIANTVVAARTDELG